MMFKIVTSNIIPTIRIVHTSNHLITTNLHGQGNFVIAVLFTAGELLGNIAHFLRLFQGSEVFRCPYVFIGGIIDLR